MKTITKRDWTAALTDVTGEEHSPKSFRTVADAQAAFEAAAREAGMSWDVTEEGIVFSDPEAAEQAQDTEQPTQDTAPGADPTDLLNVGETWTPTPEESAQIAADFEQATGVSLESLREQAAPRTPGRAATHLGTATITVVAESNPKREGTKAHAMFALYTTGMTVAEFLRAGGRRVDLRWDEAHGFISVA